MRSRVGFGYLQLGDLGQSVQKTVWHKERDVNFEDDFQGIYYHFFCAEEEYRGYVVLGLNSKPAMYCVILGNLFKPVFLTVSWG